MASPSTANILTPDTSCDGSTPSTSAQSESGSIQGELSEDEDFRALLEEIGIVVSAMFERILSFRNVFLTIEMFLC